MNSLRSCDVASFLVALKGLHDIVSSQLGVVASILKPIQASLGPMSYPVIHIIRPTQKQICYFSRFSEDRVGFGETIGGSSTDACCSRHWACMLTGVLWTAASGNLRIFAAHHQETLKKNSDPCDTVRSEWKNGLHIISLDRPQALNACDQVRHFG